MTETMATSAMHSIALVGGSLRRGLQRFIRRPSSRERRVLLMLAAAWILSGFDLGFTIVARSMGILHELNPLASYFLGVHGERGIVVYKLALMVLGTAILWHYRRKPQAELSTCLVMLVYVILATRWYVYYDDRAMLEGFPDETLPVISVSQSTVPGTRVVLGLPPRTRMAYAQSGAGDAARH